MLAIKSNLKRLPSHWLIFTMMITQVIALSEKGKGNRLPVESSLKILAKRAFGLESCNKSDPIIRWCKIIAATCSFVLLMIAAFCPTPELPKEYCFLESNEIRIFLGIGFGLLSLGFHWLGFGVCWGWSTDHWTKDYENRKWYYDGPIELIMFVSLCVLACIGVENDLSGLFFGIFSTFVVAKMVRNFMHTDEFTVISKRAGFWTAVGSVFHLEKEAEIFNSKSEYYGKQETLGNYKWDPETLKWERARKTSEANESTNSSYEDPSKSKSTVPPNSMLRILSEAEYFGNNRKQTQGKLGKPTGSLPSMEKGSEMMSTTAPNSMFRLVSEKEYYGNNRKPTQGKLRKPNGSLPSMEKGSEMMSTTGKGRSLDLTRDTELPSLDLTTERSSSNYAFATKVFNYWKQFNML